VENWTTVAKTVLEYAKQKKEKKEKKRKESG
jgi:hypothetical protein